MNSTPFPQSLKCRTLALLMSPILATVPASAGVIFSASFETPVVSGFTSNTVPTTGWVGATLGFGATNRSLYNETVAWPASAAFPPLTVPKPITSTTPIPDSPPPWELPARR